MAVYGSASNIRQYHLSGGVAAGHPQYQDISLVSDTMIAQGQKFAYDKINSLLRGQFTVPFSVPYPTLIDEYSDTIAAWWIENKRLKHLQSVEENPLNTEYAEAIEHLKEIGKTGQGLEIATATSTAYYTHAGYTPVFDLDGEFDQQLDSDLENRIANDRD